MPITHGGKKSSRFPKREFSKSVTEPSVCKSCHAVYLNKRWYYDPKLYQEQKKKQATKVTCPGCQKVIDKNYDGIIQLKSPMVKTRKDELISLLKGEEEKEREKNVLSRIAKIETRGQEMEIYTTTQFLATRLGHAVNRAFSGNLTIKPTPREAFVRVYWEREE